MTVEQVARPVTRTKDGGLPLSAEQPRVELIRSLAGRVTLDRVAGTASKAYVPPFIVKLLYWLAFQAPFPYVRNLFALRAAEARRTIAGLFTRFWFGRNLVAPVLQIECDSTGCVYVTRLVEGAAPRDKTQARSFLADVSKRFAEVGLPTWQVNPFNPRSPDNLIETADGSYRIIDLESAVVSPLLPLGQWLDALRAGSVPVFDDVFVARTRRYVRENAAQLLQALGPARLLELREAIDCYQTCAVLWRTAELRVWSRLLRGLIAALHGGARLLGLFRLASAVRAVIAQAHQGAERADAWVRDGIELMASEGRLGPEEAKRAEASLQSPETLSVMTHLGAHVAMSVPLRFPLGSIGRLAWTLAFRLKAEWRAIVRRDHGPGVRRARRIHTLPVMLLAAVPGAGAAAYVVAAPLRENRPLAGVLLDQASRKLPFRLYERLHLAALACSIACSTAQKAPVRISHGARLPHLSRVRQAAKTAFASLAPYRGLIASVLAFNIAAGALALGAGIASGNVVGPFQESGPIQALYSAELFLVGLLGYRIFARFWQRRVAPGDPEAAGIFFWLLSGGGFAWLAVDDFFKVHERIGGWIKASGGAMPLFNAADDAVVFSYGIAAFGLFYLFRGNLRSSPGAFSLLLLGLFSTGVYVAVDAFAPKGAVAAALEESANLAANAFFLSAYLVKYREVAQAAKRTARQPEAPARSGTTVGLSPGRHSVTVEAAAVRSRRTAGGGGSIAVSGESDKPGV